MEDARRAGDCILSKQEEMAVARARSSSSSEIDVCSSDLLHNL